MMPASVKQVTSYTVSTLRDSEDQAPAAGVDALQEVRFPGRDLQAETTGLALMGVKAGRRQAVAHRHEHAEEVYVVVAGSGRIKLDDDVRELRVMDAVRIAPGVTRAVEGGPDGIEFLAFGPRHDGDGDTQDADGFWPRPEVAARRAGKTVAPDLPPVADRATVQAAIDELRAREKAHTRAGDAIAAARRRLPMVEVDPTLPLVGPGGPVTLLQTFEGRRQLVAYFHMWHDGRPAGDQCEGCTFYNGQVRELSYLQSRDVTYATFCRGSYDESARYREFMGWDVPWYSTGASDAALMAGRGPFMLACFVRDGDRVFETYWTQGRGVEAMSNTHDLLDMTVHGRQETWEDSPNGWPQRWDVDGDQGRTDGRPTAQWSRLRAGRSDDLGEVKSQ